MLITDGEKSKKIMIYETLKEKIINDEIKPGTLLVERQLCTQLDASRTPIREAIQQLVSENLVTCIPTKGCFVSEIRYEDIVQLYDVRDYLERLAGKLCTQSITPSQLEHLKENIAIMDLSLTTNDVVTYYKTDIEFHRKLIEYSQNTVLVKMYEQISSRISRITQLSCKKPSSANEAHSIHAEITNALERQDAVSVEAYISEHIRLCKKSYLKLFNPNVYNQ